MKKNEIMPFAAIWMGPEIIILSEVSQRERQTVHEITYMWNLKYDRNELTYKKASLRHRKQTSLPKGSGEVGRDKLGIN